MADSLQTAATDLRGSATFDEALSIFREVLQPGCGRPTNATEVVAGPDRIAFTATMIQALDGPPTLRICVANIVTGDMQVVSFGPNLDLTPRFSPDGTRLAFRSDRAAAGNFQVYVIDLSSGMTEAAPTVSGWVESLDFSPDGKRLLVVVADHGADVAGAQGAKASKQMSNAPLPAWMPSVETGGDNSRRRSAWIIDLTERRAQQVSPAKSNVWEACWLGNDAIAAVVSAGGSEEDWYQAHLERIDVTTGASSVLYRPRDQLGGLSGAPDGRHVAIVEAVCSDRGLCAGQLLIIDAATQQAHAIDTLQTDVTHTVWRNSSELVISGVRNLESVVANVDANKGTTKDCWHSDALASLNPTYPAAQPQSEHGFVMAVQGYCEPTRIVRGADGDLRTIVSFRHRGTEKIVSKLRPVQPYAWTAPDGMEMHGWLMRGAGSGPAPLIMEVHGGPIWRWSPFFLGRTAYHAMLIERGFALFWPNPRGSSGRGQDFARSVVGDMGGADMQDCLSGLDRLVADGIADPKRLGVIGGSYGGFMTTWLVTQDDRFSAAVAVAPVTNWISQHLTSNIPCFDSFCLGGNYADSGGSYYSRSPVMFADRVGTPVLSICGALDRCTPPGQAREFHNALLQSGATSTLVTYPQEGHGARTFPAMVDYAARVVDWFECHLRAPRMSPERQ